MYLWPFFAVPSTTYLWAMDMCLIHRICNFIYIVLLFSVINKLQMTCPGEYVSARVNACPFGIHNIIDSFLLYSTLFWLSNIMINILPQKPYKTLSEKSSSSNKQYSCPKWNIIVVHVYYIQCIRVLFNISVKIKLTYRSLFKH